jgi:hypothetical protein
MIIKEENETIKLSFSLKSDDYPLFFQTITSYNSNLIGIPIIPNDKQSLYLENFLLNDFHLSFTYYQGNNLAISLILDKTKGKTLINKFLKADTCITFFYQLHKISPERSHYLKDFIISDNQEMKIRNIIKLINEFYEDKSIDLGNLKSDFLKLKLDFDSFSINSCWFKYEMFIHDFLDLCMFLALQEENADPILKPYQEYKYLLKINKEKFNFLITESDFDDLKSFVKLKYEAFFQEFSSKLNADRYLTSAGFFTELITYKEYYKIIQERFNRIQQL